MYHVLSNILKLYTRVSQQQFTDMFMYTFTDRLKLILQHEIVVLQCYIHIYNISVLQHQSYRQLSQSEHPLQLGSQPVRK